ncbi:HAL/PAL/TAL family ammonia-lyase [Effusibacillus pohliae]|uniref:HAL/PAL/TAL family ammonia-lyase n=1 Tax=Effusibacillus pohliae TaxID=232270 RepID=UPI00037196EF|nr:aromatic amino acid ammonia-lyase [Effusibacillus pohliae]
MQQAKTLVIDGTSLTMKQISDFIESPDIPIVLAPEAREKVARARRQIEKWLAEERKIIYGITTGLGKLKDHLVEEKDQEIFQRKILYSHAIGLGPTFPDEVVRLAMLLRANVLSRGHSGVRPELIERILTFLNHGVYPLLPQVGSLGVGDLQPMAHLGLCLAGMQEGTVRYRGEQGPATEMLGKAGISPVHFSFAAREALALMSGSTVLLAASIHALMQAKKLVAHSDMALSLSLEAMRGELAAYDPRIHAARGIPGQQQSARNVLAMLDGSQWTTEKGRKRLGERFPRVQDAVSLRSSPQVHGGIKDVLHYIETVLERELNASTDNPLLIPCDDGYQSLSGGNFHGGLLAYAMDFLGIVLTDLAVLSERRSARLLDPAMSYGLPANLVADGIGLNTGLALLQANAVALVAEMRVLAAPASIGSIPAKGNQEDHNSMGMGSVRKVLQMLDHARKVIAIELLCAAQAIDLLVDKMKGLSLGKGTALLHRLIRESIPPVLEDRYMVKDVERMIELLEGDELLDQISRVCALAVD